MNYRNSLLLSVAAFAFAAPALSFAAGLQPLSGEAANAVRFDNTTTSSRTRMDVLNELKAARMDGTIPASSQGNLRAVPNKDAMGKTRAQVKQELTASMGVHDYTGAF